MLAFAAAAHGQIAPPIHRPPLGGSAENKLGISNVLSEYFDSAAPSAAWTVASDPQALNWYTGAQGPGFHWENYGHGMAWRSWNVGAGAFDLKFDHAFTNGLLKQPGYQSAIAQTFGAYVAISTDPPGAQTRNTISIVAAVCQAGPIFTVRQGVPFYLQSTVTTAGANGVNLTVNNGDHIPTSAAGTYVWVNGLGPFQIQSVNTPTTLTLASGSPALVGLNHVTMGADVELSSLSGPGGGQSIQWPVGQLLTTNPPFTFEIARKQNTLTFNLFAPTFMNGAAPWGLTPGQNVLANGNQHTLSGTAATAAFQYLIVANLNGDHLTNGSTSWTGGPTSGNPAPPATAWQGSISNIRAFGAVSSGVTPTVSSVLPAPGGAIRSGVNVTVSGTGFEAGGSIRVGMGSNMRTTLAAFVSTSTLVATLPAEADGTYAFKYIAPSGVEAPLNGGIVYSPPGVSRIDPHEASPAGNETVVFTGSGFNANTSVTICGIAAATKFIDALHLQVTTPPCAAGFPAITVAGANGAFFTSSASSPMVIFGYANHPYMNFDSNGLAAMPTKWADPRMADYAAQLKRNVSIALSLTGVSGTFQPGDAVTQQGGVTGTAFGYQYGMLVVFPVSGNFAPGAIEGPNGSAVATMLFSIPSMLESFTAPVSGVRGTFNIGDTVTQSAASGKVYSFDGQTIGIVPSYNAAFMGGLAITGPSGSATPAHIALNSPNNVGADALSGWNINTWEDYGWFDVLSGTNTYANQFYNGTADLNGSNGAMAELTRIDFTDNFDQSFDLERAGNAAMLYDAMWPSLSQNQKTLFLNYLDRVRNYCNTLQTNGDTFMVSTPNYWNNWISIGNSGCIQVDLALMNSVYTVAHGSPTNLSRHVANLTDSTRGYISREMASDGVILEGSLYTSFGLTSYIWAGRSCLNAMGNDNCGAGGTGLLNAPNFLKHYAQTNLTFSGDGQWFTYCDTQPSLFGEAFLADEGDRFQQPNLLYVADDFAHRNVTGNGFTGALNQEAVTWDYAVPAFLWRSGSPASFSGWATAAYGARSNYAVLRSDASYTPNLVVGFKGQSSDAAINGHKHSDPGSFVIQDRGQAMFIDPGYFEPNAGQHTTPVVDGSAPATGGINYLATVDAASLVDAPSRKSIAIDTTAAYPSGVARARAPLPLIATKHL